MPGKANGSTNNATNIDPRVTAKLLSVAREELEKCSSFTSDIDHIFRQTEAYFDNAQKHMENSDNCDKLVFPFKRSQDLDIFLKMHSHLFKVQSGFVTLVPIKNHYCSSPRSGTNKVPSSQVPIKSSPSNEELRLDNNKVLNSAQPSNGTNPSSLLNKTLKQRVNSVVLKALADNSDRERRGSVRGEEVNNNKASLIILIIIFH